MGVQSPSTLPTHCSYVQAKGGPLPNWLSITFTVNQELEIQRECCRYRFLLVHRVHHYAN